MATAAVITNERMMSPAPVMDPLLDFTPSMEELHILGRIQPHGFLLGVQEHAAPAIGSRPSALQQPVHIAYAEQMDDGILDMYDSETPSDDEAYNISSSSGSSGSSGSGSGEGHFDKNQEQTIAPVAPLRAAASSSEEKIFTMLDDINIKSRVDQTMPEPGKTDVYQSSDVLSSFEIHTVSWNLQSLVAEHATVLLGQPLRVLFGAAQIRRLRADLASCHQLSDLNPWRCVLHVREEVIRETQGVADVLRDRISDRRRVDRLAKVPAAVAADPERWEAAVLTPHLRNTVKHGKASDVSPLTGMRSVRTDGSSAPHTQAARAEIHASESIEFLPVSSMPSTATAIPVPVSHLVTPSPIPLQPSDPRLPPSVRLPFPPVPAPTIPLHTGPLVLQAFDVCFHRSGGLLVMEFEPAPVQPMRSKTAANFRRQALQTMARLQHAQSSQDVLRKCAEEMRKVTGYDRVMVYQFHPDGSGEVVNESKTTSFELDSFLGLLYPSSDIPPQARALYVRSKIRMIGDVAFRGVGLLPQVNPLTHAPFDLSNALLRSVHPTHLQYLRNMGVRASMSVSIVVDGELWGLISCHHYRSSRYLDHETRLVSELIGDLLATQIPFHLQRERMAQLAVMRTKLDLVSHLIVESHYRTTWIEVLLRERDMLFQLFEITGFAILTGGRMVTAGEVPLLEQVLPLAAYALSVTRPNKSFSSSCLSSIHPAAAQYAAIGSGVLSLVLSVKDGDMVLLFRPEFIHTLSYGGKPVTDAGTEHLSPRNSFAVWQTTKHNQSKEWSSTMLEFAEEFKRLLQEVKLIHFYQDAGQQEKTRLLWSEEMRKKQVDFIDKICHEIRNPINGIMGSILLARDDIMQLQNVFRSRQPPMTSSNPSSVAAISPANQMAWSPNAGASSSGFSFSRSINNTPIAPSRSLMLRIKSASTEQDIAEQHFAELLSNITNIEECARHQKVIADDVLGLSKLEQNRVVLSATPFDLKQCILAVIQMHEAPARLKNLSLLCDFDIPYTHVTGDSFRLRQIVSNVLGNSIKFTQRGHIKISVRVLGSNCSHVKNRAASQSSQHGGTGDAVGSNTVSDDSIGASVSEDDLPVNMGSASSPKSSFDGIAAAATAATAAASSTQAPIEYEVMVEDTGVGISESALHILFQPYMQATSRVSAAYEGSGLGLCIARELARLMGGDVTLSSRVGEGTVCCITFLAHPLNASQISNWQLQQQVQDEADALMDQVRGTVLAPFPGKNFLHVTPMPSVMATSQQESLVGVAARSSDGALARLVPSVQASRPVPDEWRPRVLIMEDNAINMKVLKRLLESLGCICSGAQDGAQGVRMFEEAYCSPESLATAYHIVCSDLEMPVMNGLEAIRIIRQMEAGASSRNDSDTDMKRNGGRRKRRRKAREATIAARDTTGQTTGQIHKSTFATHVDAHERPPLVEQARFLHPNEAAVTAAAAAAAAAAVAAAAVASVFVTTSSSSSDDDVMISSDSPAVPPPCYLVCISGNVRQEYVDAVQAAGIDQYCSKPFSKAVLQDVLACAWQKHARYLVEVKNQESRI